METALSGEEGGGHIWFESSECLLLGSAPMQLGDVAAPLLLSTGRELEGMRDTGTANLGVAGLSDTLKVSAGAAVDAGVVEAVKAMLAAGAGDQDRRARDPTHVLRVARSEPDHDQEDDDAAEGEGGRDDATETANADLPTQPTILSACSTPSCSCNGATNGSAPKLSGCTMDGAIPSPAFHCSPAKWALSDGEPMLEDDTEAPDSDAFES